MRRLAFAVLVGVAITILSACRATTASPELTGQPWQLTSITESSPAFTALIPPADQSRYQITFKTDNSYFATADCNNLVGTYVARDAKLTIKVGPSTLVACGSGSFGAIFAHALTSASTYAIADNALTIGLDGAGRCCSPPAVPRRWEPPRPPRQRRHPLPRAPPRLRRRPRLPRRPHRLRHRARHRHRRASRPPRRARRRHPRLAPTATPTPTPTPAPSGGTGLAEGRAGT